MYINIFIINVAIGAIFVQYKFSTLYVLSTYGCSRLPFNIPQRIFTVQVRCICCYYLLLIYFLSIVSCLIFLKLIKDPANVCLWVHGIVYISMRRLARALGLFQQSISSSSNYSNPWNFFIFPPPPLYYTHYLDIYIQIIFYFIIN